MNSRITNYETTTQLTTPTNNATPFNETVLTISPIDMHVMH